MSDHAILSPSSAGRWLVCPGSVRLSEQVHDTPSDSPYAQEGTDAHELGELTARKRFGMCTEEEYLDAHRAWSLRVDDEKRADMERHIDAYCALLAEAKGNDFLFLEQRLPTGVPEVWGTADAVIVGATHVHVIDLKYGMGVEISAKNNSQLMLYALGALEMYDLFDGIETVKMTIFQPRLGNTSNFEMRAHELRAWRDQVAAPAALIALSDDAPFHPSESACRFCPAAGLCRARSKWVAETDFREPDLLTPDELAEALDRVKMVEQWCVDIRTAALDLAYLERVKIPGYKVVSTYGRRSIPDDAGAIQALIDLGFRAEQVADFRIKSFGALERLLGARGLNGALGDFIEKSDGKPCLVKETDKRPEISPVTEAQMDFGPHHTT